MIQVGEYGIKNIVEIVDFGMASIHAIYQAKANGGKIDINDIGFFLPALMALPPALSGIGEVVHELKDLQAEELEFIKSHVLNKWKMIPGINENYVKLIGAAFKIGEGIYEGLEAVGGLKS